MTFLSFEHFTGRIADDICQPFRIGQLDGDRIKLTSNAPPGGTFATSKTANILQVSVLARTTVSTKFSGTKFTLVYLTSQVALPFP
jgi:hypothetical protein